MGISEIFQQLKQSQKECPYFLRETVRNTLRSSRAGALAGSFCVTYQVQASVTKGHRSPLAAGPQEK